MRKVMTCVVAAAVAVLLVGAFVSVSSAGRYSLNDQTFRAISAESEFENGSGGERAFCPMTLSGSFSSRTFAKTIGSVVGRVNTVRIGESSCTGGAELSAESRGLPLNIEYRSFEGTLPNISGLGVQNPQMVDVIKIYHMPFFFTCTYSYQEGNFVQITIRREALGWKRYVLRALLSLQEGNLLCPRRLGIRDEGPWTRGDGGMSAIALI